MKLQYLVNENNMYLNVKEVLKAYFNISDRLLRKLKNNKKIFLNNVPVYISEKIKIGDLITINLDFIEDNSNIVPTKMDLHILYEDDGLLIINKPPFLPVHPSMQHYNDSLSNGVRYYYDLICLKRKIRPVIRIDKDTSGIVIFAKNEYIQERLISQMKSKKFEKEYIAICDGFFSDTPQTTKTKGTINLPIGRKNGSIIERCIRPDGDIAITHYEVISEKVLNISNFKYTIVKCKLETGRTHQIRVHMASIGHPILGDTLYGNKNSEKNINENFNKITEKNQEIKRNTCVNGFDTYKSLSNFMIKPEIKRQLLHAYKVKFIHPITKNELEIKAPIPDDMLNLM